MDKLGIFLNFNGNCADVLQFYTKVFDTTPGTVTKFGDTPDNQIPGFENKIMYADIMIGGENLMMSDAPPNYNHIVGNNFCMNYSNTNNEKLNNIFAALSEGGTIVMPMQKTFFSELFGMVTDKFGITWNVMA